MGRGVLMASGPSQAIYSYIPSIHSQGTRSHLSELLSFSGFDNFLKAHDTDFEVVKSAYEAAEKDFTQALAVHRSPILVHAIEPPTLHENNCYTVITGPLGYNSRPINEQVCRSALSMWRWAHIQLMDYSCRSNTTFFRVSCLMIMLCTSVQELRDVAYAFCKAASVLHGEGIVHRDMRMSNVVCR